MEKKHILIIEDDTTLAELLSKQLASAGFDVAVASDGEEGLRLAEKKPDLILLDILLPKQDGFSVMETIRKKNEWGAAVPIIIISNVNPDDDRAVHSVAEYTPVFYLIKSEHALGDIVEKIQDVLSPSAQ